MSMRTVCVEDPDVSEVTGRTVKDRQDQQIWGRGSSAPHHLWTIRTPGSGHVIKGKK